MDIGCSNVCQYVPPHAVVFRLTNSVNPLPSVVHRIADLCPMLRDVLSVIRRLEFGCTLLFLLSVYPAQGQSVRAIPGSHIYQEAESQWMCQWLASSSSTVFDYRLPEFPASIQAPEPLRSFPEANSLVLEIAERLWYPDGRTSRIVAMKSLCDLYFPLFYKKLKSHGLPQELAILPVFLTGLNADYTDSRGRAGMWAMDYFTARRQGLRIDEFVDERRGGDFTTDAAVKVLSRWYTKYEGDMRRTVLAWAFSPAYAEQLSFDDASLPLEVVEFLALYRHLYALITLMNTPNFLQAYFDVFSRFEQLFFEQPVAFEALENVLGIKSDLLHDWNSVYIGETIDPTFRRVPFQMTAELVYAFRENAERIYSYEPERTKPVETMPVEQRLTHTVRSGETLGSIASKYKVSVSDLKNWNRLKTDRIRIGQSLVIIWWSVAGVTSEQAGAATIEENRGGAATTDEPLIHRVRSGESLWTIARQYPGITPAHIMEWNNCDEHIQPGQKLKIYRVPQR